MIGLLKFQPLVVISMKLLRAGFCGSPTSKAANWPPPAPQNPGNEKPNPSNANIGPPMRQPKNWLPPLQTRRFGLGQRAVSVLLNAAGISGVVSEIFVKSGSWETSQMLRMKVA